MSLKVIGAGFGRTGTKSLQLALQQIGLGPCYHMETLLRNSEDVKYWSDAYKGKDVDWDSLFQCYQSAVDFPTAIYYKQLAEHYPDAKVILTVRDEVDWYESVERTIYSFDPGARLKLKMLAQLPFSATARNLFRTIMLNNTSIWKHFFNNEFTDKEKTISRYRAHIEEVKQNIPAERLLVFRSTDGWQPLCDFLDVPVPNTQFPNTNHSEDFHSWARSIVEDVLSSSSGNTGSDNSAAESKPV